MVLKKSYTHPKILLKIFLKIFTFYNKWLRDVIISSRRETMWRKAPGTCFHYFRHVFIRLMRWDHVTVASVGPYLRVMNTGAQFTLSSHHSVNHNMLHTLILLLSPQWPGPGASHRSCGGCLCCRWNWLAQAGQGWPMLPSLWPPHISCEFAAEQDRGHWLPGLALGDHHLHPHHLHIESIQTGTVFTDHENQYLCFEC